MSGDEGTSHDDLPAPFDAPAARATARSGGFSVTASVARAVVVHGEVQGVGFREHCRREAVAAGVTGWVRNQDDGTVQAHVEGDPEAVQTMVAWVGHGPRHAHVARADVREVAVEGFARFEVR